MIKRTLKLFALFLILTYSLNSCQADNECETSAISHAKLDFYIIEDDKEKAVGVEGISIYGLGREDSLIYEIDTISYALLQLSPAADTVGFVFDYGSFSDTISFLYKTNKHFESIECGFIANFDIDTVKYSENAIDSVALIDNTITSEDEQEHVKIFFK